MSMTPELAVRRAKATDEVRQIRRPVLGPAAVEVKHVATILDVVASSTLVYNAGTWTCLPPRAMNSLHCARMAIYRAAARAPRWDPRPLSDHQVLGRVGRLTTTDALAIERLRYFPRVVQYAPDLLLALHQQTAAVATAWRGPLLMALEWLHNCSRAYTALPSPSVDLTA